ncbi:hypothetical protein [Desulfosporosinus sp. BICA1-9]|uniref:hypothetical protein n=1 Tax=Desulfosporosinus sp. BICA1-9 TaxID=1531958 RepID=UPI00054B4842|nr:hypothetical protein [Desulfosporosinus sp. BICA1-9]KJS50905.1 MAG: hypothetical protein VR66_00190 [Peptococcaceae bacterium BRH_c23]KJS78455.1 MAG: hypothetical protein JL57_31555 [Desulfosporosinus sp. BICA1-9]
MTKMGRVEFPLDLSSFADINNDLPKSFFAKGEEGLAEAGKLREGCLFNAMIIEEKGFSFVQSINLAS